jgi:predicted porin
MNNRFLKFRYLLIPAFLFLSQQAVSDDSKGFQHRIALYLWGAGLSGNVGNAAGASPVNVSFDDILDNMEAAFMGNYRLKASKWAFGLEYIYLNLAPTSDTPPATVDLKQSILELTGGYELAPGLEALAGIRYVDISMNTTLNISPTPPSISGEDDWVDPIIGLDYRTALSEKWQFYGRGDIGGFGVGSDVTWQLAAYFGYMPSERWNLFAGYRHLDFDYKSDNENRFFYDMGISGPLVGFGFLF